MSDPSTTLPTPRGGVIAAEPGQTAADPLAVFHPSLRLASGLVFSVAVVALQSHTALVTALGCALIALGVARPRLSEVRRRILALEGFMVMILIMLPFTMPAAAPERVLFDLGPLVASRDGLDHAIAIFLKANTVVLSLTALIGRMEPTEFGRALTGLRLPDTLVSLLLLTVRYLDVLRRDSDRLRRSMRIRGFRARANPHSLRSLGYLVGILLVRSFDRSERIVAAMRCRGFDGAFPRASVARPAGRDAVLAAAAGLAIAVCVWIDWAAAL